MLGGGGPDHFSGEIHSWCSYPIQNDDTLTICNKWFVNFWRKSIPLLGLSLVSTGWPKLGCPILFATNCSKNYVYFKRFILSRFKFTTFWNCFKLTRFKLAIFYNNREINDYFPTEYYRHIIMSWVLDYQVIF